MHEFLSTETFVVVFLLVITSWFETLLCNEDLRAKSSQWLSKHQVKGLVST
jgi:hypothetical protein